jgi:hypothetical protein
MHWLVCMQDALAQELLQLNIHVSLLDRSVLGYVIAACRQPDN